MDVPATVEGLGVVQPTSPPAQKASGFFRCAPVGYAATPKAGVFDGVALATGGWAIEPLHLDEVRSSFFDDPHRFAAGTATPDSAFLMVGLDTP